MGNIWEDKEPDFVNEKGVKWWFDEDTTRYGKLPHYKVFFIQDKSYLSWVIIDYRTNKVVYESQGIEDICVHLEMLRLMEEAE